MFRRSRLSIRPNVGATGRAASTPQEAPPSNQESAEPPKDNSESIIATAGTDNKSAVVQSEQTPPARDSNDQNVESTTSSAALQRRKRFSIKPKVVPGRPATLPRTPKSPIKPVLQSHIEVPNSDLDKPTSSQVSTTAPPKVLLSPRHRRASEESRQAKTHPKPTLPSSGSSETLSVPPAEDSVEQIHLRPDGGKKESSSAGQVKEVSLRQPDKVPPSLPDKEATEMSEKAKTLVSSKNVISTSSSKFSLSRLLNDPSDLQRLEKAQKLRELLREEINKEKLQKLKKAKARVKEYNLDPAKMTMRDLIHYLPMSNPMTSSLQESAQEKETVLPQSPVREKSPERAQEPQAQLKMMSPRQQRAEEEEEEEEEAAADDEQDEALMVPQVKVAEDGSLIIDEESLTVEVQRTKGPNTVQDRDPIFERGSTTTYASFRKGNYSKPWSSEETDMFFLAISMVGTDFTMICQLFPHRGRSEIKNKFKKEERGNAWRIDKAFREKRRLDIEYFSKLLEKILEVQKNKKKLKSLSVKNKTPKKCVRKPKGKKAARKLSDVEEENEVDEEEEGEKENEELCNEGGSPVSKPTRKRKRKNDKGDASPEQPDSKINKRGEKKKKQDEASVPTDTEAALPEDHTTSTTSDQCDAPKDIAEIKPAKLSRGRAPKLPLPVGLKRSKKPAPSSTKSKENTSDKEGENMSEEASTEQVSKGASPSRQTNERESADENVESDEECSVKPPRPTRYGRVPKLTRHLNYPAKKETHSPASETTPASPAGHAASAAKAKPKGTAKRGRSARQQPAKESKKPKLITLRASQSEDSDDEDDEPSAAEAIMGCAVSCSSIDGGAAVFVPASLCSPHPLVTEVEETMEELDILANMPDVLGISQDALCPEASCEQAQNEAGTAEPCEHQLDLLVDVIDFLSSEHTEVSEDESYNEAAQTLLTIGNVAHLSHPSQNQASMEDLPNTSVIANESSHQEESQSVPDLQQEISTCPISVVSAHEITEPSETVRTMEPESNTTEERPPSQIADTSMMNHSEEMYCEQKTDAVTDSQLQSNPESSKKTSVQTKKGRFSKIKPKPNIARASRTTQSNSQTNNNKLSLKTAEDGHSSASDIFQVSHSQQVPENISELQNSGPTVTGEISCSDVRLTEEPSGRQEAGRSVIADQSTSENQNSCIPETQLESSRENQLTTGPTDDRTGEISYSNSLTSITVTGSASVYEGTDLVCVSLINQKEETEVTNTLETRRGRLHEVKSTDSQLQASETEQPKTQTTQDPVTHLELVDKPSIQTANLQPTEKPAKKMETEPTGNATLSETPSQSTGPDSVFVSSVNMDSTHETAQKLSITEEKKTDVEFAGQADSCSESSEQNVPQRRRRFPKVKPKPNLGSSPRSTQPRAQLKCLSKSSNQLCKDSSSNATSEQQQSVEENSAKTQVESAETDSQHLTPSHSSLNIELSSANAGNAESEKSLGSTNEKDAQSDSIVMATSWVAESETMFTDSVSENKTNTRPPVEESTGGCISNQDKVETLDTEAASLCNTEQEINSRTTGSNTQPVGDPSTVSIVQHSHDVSALTTKAESIPENTQQSQSETHSDIQSQDAAQHRSETNETKQANRDKCPPHESFSETQDVPADSSKTSRKPQTQRGRFIKPKPNLGRSSRPQRPQSKTENMTDSAVCSDNANAFDSQKAVSELRSDVQVTLEGAKEQVGGLHVPPNDAGSTLGDLTQVHDSSAQSFQDATTSSTMETLNYQSLSIFQEILTEQVPSDPDEPFFVLSLTAIPVCPSGEVLDTVSEPYLPVTDVLAQQESSGPGETVTAGSDGSFANIHVPTSTEASNETDLISGKETGPDPAVSEQNLLMERPENPQDGSSAQPPNLPDATENTQESDDPPTKQETNKRQTGRRAKLQVKPKTARNRQVRNKESLAAEEANKSLQTNTTQDAEIPRPSVQPEATDSTAKTWIEIISDSEEEGGDHLVTEKSGEAVEDRSSGAQSQTAESRGKRQTRKSKNVLPVISETNSTKQPSDPPQAKASTRSKVKAPRAARRRTSPPAVASTSHDVAYSTIPEETHSPVSATPPSQIQMDVQQSEDHSQPLSDTAPSTSECTAKVSSTQQSDWMESSQVDDEPTSVSQYFLSDIFTDVEDE